MNARTTIHHPTVMTAPTLHPSPVRGVAVQLRRGAGLAGDVLLAGGVVFAIPFVILAIGIPIALVVQLLLRIARLF